MDDAAQVPGGPPAGIFGRHSYKMARALRGIGGSAITLILIFVYFSATQSSFLTGDNIDNILRSSTPLWIASIGMTFVIIGGGLDLSIGSLAALSGVILTQGLSHGASPVVALLLTIAACFLIGYVLNGVSIGGLGFNFFIVTLATLSIFRGAALVVSDATSSSTYDVDLIQKLGDGNFGFLPVPVLIAVVLTVGAYLVLRYTRFGRMVFAVGGNEEAARISGINVSRVRIMLYGISGLMAGISGLILTGRLTSSQPVSGGIGLELSAAAAVLLGGTKFTGGYGGVGRTLVGVLYIGVLQSGLTIAGVQSYWQQVATGVILFLAVAFDRLQRE
jgi:ribose transport system permease protein